MTRKWMREDIMAITKGFQPACVLFAATDLDIFSLIAKNPITAKALADKLQTDVRATTVVLDALAAMELLTKQDGRYAVPETVAGLLMEDSPVGVLAMVRHQANCLRRWVHLPGVIKTGRPTEPLPSIRGQNADLAAFIDAMDNVSIQSADQVIAELGPLRFRYLLDVGGASGTWTIAFLRAAAHAKAALFDLPQVIPMARKRIADAGLADRVTFVPGDFYKDELPKGADFVWLSAIAHQNSRTQNRTLFSKIYSAMQNDSVLLLRDVVMDTSRTEPEAGALFAVNMLAATQGGGTYTFDEFRDDLSAAGFTDVSVLRRDEFMNSLIRAAKKQ